jgi:hypothetical protein
VRGWRTWLQGTLKKMQEGLTPKIYPLFQRISLVECHPRKRNPDLEIVINTCTPGNCLLGDVTDPRDQTSECLHAQASMRYIRRRTFMTQSYNFFIFVARRPWHRRLVQNSSRTGHASKSVLLGCSESSSSGKRSGRDITLLYSV